MFKLFPQIVQNFVSRENEVVYSSSWDLCYTCNLYRTTPQKSIRLFVVKSLIVDSSLFADK